MKQRTTGFFSPLIIKPLTLKREATRPTEPITASAPQRDFAIDVLRGWAIVMMIFSHVGPLTRLSALVHLPLYVSAAGWFFGLSGLVLGMVSRRRIEKSGFRVATFRLLRRVRLLWIIHCVLTFLVILWHTETGRLTEVVTPAQVGGWFNVVWMVATLRLQSNEFMNILPMYIAFMLLAPLVLKALARHLTGLVLAVSFGLYLYAQTHPAFLRLADPVSGKQIFSEAAWQFVFFGGLVLGYHHEAVKTRFWQRHQRWILPLTAFVFVTLFVVAQFQRTALNHYGVLDYHALLEPLFSKLTWPPLRAVYTSSMIFLAYYCVNTLLKQNHPVVRFLQPLALMGRYSLYCFLVHLFFSLAGRSYGILSWNTLLQEVITLITVWLIYFMTRKQVLAWLIPN